MWFRKGKSITSPSPDLPVTGNLSLGKYLSAILALGLILLNPHFALAQICPQFTATDYTTFRWEYRGGTGNNVNQPRVFTATPTTPANPGARYDSASWVDNEGMFWLFGGTLGNTFANDLWKYNPVTSEWLCVMNPPILEGDYTGDNPFPGMRIRPTTWTDSRGNLWMFGGIGLGAIEYGNLNDLWKFDVGAQKWVFVNGSEMANIPGDYTGPNPFPGARSGAAGWKDHNGNLMLFGGETTGGHNDVWRFDLTTLRWEYVNIPGTSSVNVSGSYPGYGYAPYFPGGRHAMAAWNDNEGNGYIFGGHGVDSATNKNLLNDLWKFNSRTNTWTYLSGSHLVNATGVYGPVGSSGGHPGARNKITAWNDRDGNLWLFGGEGYGINPLFGYLNDVWKYDIADARWTYFSGSTTINTYSNYTTAPHPGSRYSAAVWDDGKDHFWMFGGWGMGTSVIGRLNDIWRLKNISKHASPYTITATAYENESILLNITNINDPSGVGEILLPTETTPHGTVEKVAGTTNTILYTPDKQFRGRDTFTVNLSINATDLLCPVASAPVIIDVIDANFCPAAEDISATLNQNEPAVITPIATDPDGDPLTPLITKPPLYGTAEIAEDGTIIYTPNLDFTGTDSFLYRMTDGQCLSNEAYVTLTVIGVNSCPVISDITLAALPGTTLSVPYSVVTGKDNPLTAYIVYHPTQGTVSVSPDGNIIYNAAPSFTGGDQFIYRVFDGECMSNFATVTIRSAENNHCPAAQNLVIPVHPATPTLLPLHADDEDGDRLAAILETSPLYGTATITSAGLILYTPPEDFSTTDTLTYSLTDGACKSHAATISLRNASLGNQCPQISDAAIDLDAGTSVEFPLSLTDADGDTLRVRIIEQPRKGTASVSPDGVLRYTASPNFSGTDRLTVSASDSLCESAPAVIILRSSLSNVCPVAYPVTVPATPGGIASVPFSALDTNGDLLTVSIVDQPRQGFAHVADNGTIIYSAGPGFSGTDTFTYRVSDGLCESEPASVTVRGDNNTCPVIQNVRVVASPGVPLMIPLKATDADHDALTPRIETPPSRGTAQVFPDGTIIYTPNADFRGPDYFTYRVSDGLCVSGIAAVNIRNSDNNRCAVAENANVTAALGSVTDIVPEALDQDNDTLLAIITGHPTHGRAFVLNSGVIRYVPGPGFTDLDTLRYRVTDGHCLSNEAEIYISGKLDNRVPAIQSVTYTPDTVYFDTPVTFTVTAADPDNDPLVYTYDYGDGTINNLGTHSYPTTGTYLVRTYASDGYSTVSSRLTLDVVERPLTDINGDGQINSMDRDTDGDSFPDAIEIGYGTDPWNRRETPAGLPPAPIVTYRPNRYVVPGTLRRAKNNLSWKTELIIPSHKNAASTDTKMILNVGGIVREFNLNKKGSAKNDKWQVRFTPGKINKNGTGPISIVFKIKNADVATLVKNSTVNGNNRPTQITIDFYYAGKMYSTVQWLDLKIK